MNDYLNEAKQRLKQYKNQIELLQPGDEKRNDLIKQYNECLDDISVFIWNPLPEEYEIEESLLVEWYQKEKESVRVNGYYTFEKYVHSVDIVAEVNIKKVNDWRRLVHADVIKSYKGQLPSRLVFRALMKNRDNCFEKGETCIILLNNSLLACGYNKMEIVTYNNEKYVVCSEHDQNYWGKEEMLYVSGNYLMRYDDLIGKVLRAI